MAMTVSERVQKRRDALKSAGLRPVQIWIPDTRRSGFSDECRRQSILIAKADKQDVQLENFMDSALNDLDSWQ